MLLKSLLLPLALLQATSALSINSSHANASDKHQLQANTETIDIPFSCLGSQSPGICFTVAAVGVTLYKVGNYLHYRAAHTTDPQARGIVNFMFANGVIPVHYGPGIASIPGQMVIVPSMGPGVKLQK